MDKKIKPPKIDGFLMFGGDEEDRTLDLTDANRTLSQLSYGPVSLSNGIIHHPKENFKSK